MLSKRFGADILFDEVSVKFTPGNCYGLVGANGSGKSTFVKILAGIEPATSGAVTMKITNNTSMTSMYGTTLIWFMSLRWRIAAYP